MKDYIKVDVDILYKLSTEYSITNYGEILLYSKIEDMSVRKGYCSARNKYFSQILNTTERNIQKYLKDLKNKGCIKIFENKVGTYTESRKIYPQVRGEQMDAIGVNECTSPHEQMGRSPRTNGSKPLNKWVEAPEQMITQVIDSNRIVIDSSKDAAAVALLDVADAPKRCATLAHQKSEWKFDGAFLDKDMLGIIRRECEKLYPEYRSGSSDFSDIHELREYLLEKYSDTQGYYRCKNIDELESCINYLTEGR